MTSKRAPLTVRPLPARQREELRRAIEARRFGPRMKAALLALLEGASSYRAAAEAAGLRHHRDVAKAAASVPGLREAHVRELLAARRGDPLARLWRRHLERSESAA